MRLINVWLQTSNHWFLLLREFDFGRTLFFARTHLWEAHALEKAWVRCYNESRREETRANS
jgi:hypothetical protein